MGDATGQLSQRLGLLRLDERGLGLLALGDLTGELLVRLQELAGALLDAILELLIDRPQLVLDGADPQQARTAAISSAGSTGCAR